MLGLPGQSLRPRAPQLTLVAVLLGACAGSTSSPTSVATDASAPIDAGDAGDASMPAIDAAVAPGVCRVAPAAACQAARHVATAKEALAAAIALGWDGPYSARDLGSDLVADADLELRADDIKPPADRCGDPNTQCSVSISSGVYPQWDERVPGAGCTAESPSCPTLLIAKGTRFRLIVVYSAGAPFFEKLVQLQLVSPCAESCSADRFLCPTNHLCLAGYQLCSACEGHDANYCSCRTPDCAVLPTGAACSFYDGSDLGKSGACTPDKGCVKQ